MTNNIEETTLGSLKEIAKNTTIRNYKQIQDFKYIDVNIELSKRVCQTKNGENFEIKEVSLYNEDTDEVDRVRVPNSVITGLHVLLKDNPNLKYFRVIKTGEGMNTRYTVLPVSETDVLKGV